MRLICILLLSALGLAAKPNILFIFADDQCFDTISALSDEKIETPALDSLVREGTSFTNTYNMGAWNGAVCIASRTMILNGRTLWRAEEFDNKEGAVRLIEGEQTWPQLLEKAGYETYFAGKWHTKVPPIAIFDHIRNQRGGMPFDAPEGYNRPLADGSDTWDPADPAFGGFWGGGKHWSEVVADDAEEYFKIAAGSDKPFFFYLSFNAPHDPRQAPQEYLDKYPADEMILPANFLSEYPHMDSMGMIREDAGHTMLRDEALAPFPRTEHAVKVHRREYYALITHMDAQIGRILTALEKSGKKEETYIIFTADHGLACGQHGLLGKQNMYEHSLKPPLVLVGKDIPKNERRDALVHLQDVLPTTLELAGHAKPDYIEFESLLPIAKSEPGAKGRDYMLGSYVDSQRMIRVGDYKLIVYPKSNTLRLFNLTDDPLEVNDLINEESQSKRVKDLFGQLQKRLKEHGDPLDLSSVKI